MCPRGSVRIMPRAECGTPNDTIPSGSRGIMSVTRVLSCSPCVEAVDVKAPAGLLHLPQFCK